MTNMQIFTGTLKFVFLKLAMGLIPLIVGGVVLGLAALFGAIAGSGITLLGIFLALLAMLGSLWAVSYFGYMIKAGHIVVIAHAVANEELPEDQFGYAFAAVKERFVTANVFYVVDRLISGAVRQLQSTITKFGDFLAFIPGMNILVQFLNMFISIALGFVDECCLAYTFFCEEQGPFESACDGVVIYAQNIKELLKNAAKLALLVILMCFGAFLILMLIGSAITRVTGFPIEVMFFMAILLVSAVKGAFVDTWLLISTMKKYLELAAETELQYDLYEKLCKMSRKFKNLFDKSQNEVNMQGLNQTT